MLDFVAEWRDCI